MCLCNSRDVCPAKVSQDFLLLFVAMICGNIIAGIPNRRRMGDSVECMDLRLVLIDMFPHILEDGLHLCIMLHAS